MECIRNDHETFRSIEPCFNRCIWNMAYSGGIYYMVEFGSMGIMVYRKGLMIKSGTDILTELGYKDVTPKRPGEGYGKGLEQARRKAQERKLGA